MRSKDSVKGALISVILYYSYSRNGKGLQLSIYSRRKMRDFLRFHREKRDSKSPLNIISSPRLTMRDAEWGRASIGRSRNSCARTVAWHALKLSLKRYRLRSRLKERRRQTSDDDHRWRPEIAYVSPAAKWERQLQDAARVRSSAAMLAQHAAAPALWQGRPHRRVRRR
jgi:hypothetical protein